MIIAINGVARPAAPRILTATTLREAVERAKSGNGTGKAKKVPVAVVHGNEVKVVSR